jgi:hypothetical protein
MNISHDDKWGVEVKVHKSHQHKTEVRIGRLPAGRESSG